MRHDLLTAFDPKPGVSIATLAYEYPPDHRVPEHAHGSDQVIYAVRGVMEVSAGQSCWLIPPNFAIWIPARMTHRIRMAGAVSMRTVYLRRGLAVGLPVTCVALHVTPLLRELMVEIVRLGQLRLRNRLHTALRDVFVAQLCSASPMPIGITMPRDRRALAVGNQFLSDVSSAPTLRDLCDQAGVSVRTIERVFRSEAGMDFESWKRQVRLMKAAELLARGHSVKETAYAVGYRQPSAFVVMFRRTLGTTPKLWVAALGRS